MAYLAFQAQFLPKAGTPSTDGNERGTNERGPRSHREPSRETGPSSGHLHDETGMPAGGRGGGGTIEQGSGSHGGAAGGGTERSPGEVECGRLDSQERARGQVGSEEVGVGGERQDESDEAGGGEQNAEKDESKENEGEKVVFELHPNERASKRENITVGVLGCVGSCAIGATYLKHYASDTLVCRRADDEDRLVPHCKGISCWHRQKKYMRPNDRVRTRTPWDKHIGDVHPQVFGACPTLKII